MGGRSSHGRPRTGEFSHCLPGRLLQPIEVAALPQGAVAVADRGNSRLQIFPARKAARLTPRPPEEAREIPVQSPSGRAWGGEGEVLYLCHEHRNRTC